MFGFLKDKLKQAAKAFSKSAEDELDEEPIEKPSKDDKRPSNKPSNKKSDKSKTASTKKLEEKSKSKKEDKADKKSEKKDKFDKKDKKDKKEDMSSSKEKAHSKEKEHKVESHKDHKEKNDSKKHSEKIKEEKKSDGEESDERLNEESEESKQKSEEKKGFFGKIFGFGKKEESKEEKKEKDEQEDVKDKLDEEQAESEEENEDLDEELEEDSEEDEDDDSEEEEKKESKEKPEEKKGFFGKLTEAVTKKSLSDEKFEELFWDLEMGLLESNIAVEVIEKIKSDLKVKLVNSRISRFEVENIVVNSLKESIDDILTFEKVDLVKNIKAKKEKPYVVVFVGVNGSGKTTNLAKIANYLKDKGLTVVLAAGDTFRAAAIHQLEIHANKIGVKIIKQDYGSDAAAVAFDAISHARANKKDVVLIDTAGRSHANANLMDELKKVVRVAKPDLTLFVGDSLTGNDMVEQAKEFNAAVSVDGLILSKADVDEKGGATISATYVTKKPIVFIGTGQEYKDIEEFDKKKIMKNLEI